MDLPLNSPSKTLKKLFWISFLLTLAFMVWMRQYLAPLESGEIVRYEMAKSPGVAASMIDQWKQENKFDLVIKSIYIDYIFIVVYLITIALACRFFSLLSGNEILIKAGKFFSFFIIAGGIFDVIENLAMMKSLQGSVTDTNVSLAYKMAITKFSIVLMALFFIAACFFAWLVSRFPVKEKFWK